MPVRAPEHDRRNSLLLPRLPVRAEANSRVGAFYGEDRRPGLGAYPAGLVAHHHRADMDRMFEEARAAVDAYPLDPAEYDGSSAVFRPTSRRVRMPAPKDERPVVQEDDCSLQFDLIFTDGGEYSPDYSCFNLLRNDGSCYSSLKRDRVNVVAKVKGEPHFSMTDIEAIAPIEGYTSPLGQGCVFVSWDAPNTALVKHFDEVTSREEFESLSQQAKNEPVLPSTPVPVGFFEISRTCRATQHLPVPRSGRYILIKLLRSQVVPSENVDVQYIGFRGLSSPHGFECGSFL